MRGPDDAAAPDVQDVVAPMPIDALPVCEECWIAASDKVRELIEALDGVVASKLADSSADQACKKVLIAPGGMGKPSVSYSVLSRLLKQLAFFCTPPLFHSKPSASAIVTRALSPLFTRLRAEGIANMRSVFRRCDIDFRSMK